MKFDPLLRILCVDDNIQILTALKRGLETYGFEVVPASHGIDALMQYKAHTCAYQRQRSLISLMHNVRQHDGQTERCLK